MLGVFRKKCAYSRCWAFCLVFEHLDSSCFSLTQHYDIQPPPVDITSWELVILFGKKRGRRETQLINEDTQCLQVFNVFVGWAWHRAPSGGQRELGRLYFWAAGWHKQEKRCWLGESLYQLHNPFKIWFSFLKCVSWTRPFRFRTSCVLWLTV